jgi:hypothetical protein
VLDRAGGVLDRAGGAVSGAGEQLGRWISAGQGDWLERLAQEHGLPNWQRIWNDPNNAELRQEREHPNILLPGDRVFIPAAKEKQEPGATEMRHRFRRPLPQPKLRLRIEDADRQPMTGRSYVIVLRDRILSGVTDGQGMLEHDIPFNAGSRARFEGEAATRSASCNARS